MIVRKDLTDQVIVAIESAQNSGDLPVFELPEVVISKPREVSFGDYACPTAMQLARLAKMAPLKIAEVIAAHLPEVSYLAEVNVAPPGFINFRLTVSDAALINVFFNSQSRPRDRTRCNHQC